ncbi:hypothetical protein G7A72_13945 [Flavobacterium sp. Sr18]|uniref:hypothetical protein n=1 Tax=Flavobacterium sp. Sr18 TaxID=935222 RepID=UPI0013E49B33|nr:hypothetical protein [Flavobacterium sp. Sr18]QIH39847.1 hypothetical protein G7A72_13945 [Flavobacterium sp. Sr18]
MRLIQSLLIFAFVLLSTNIISAQYGNGGYGNGYGNNYGSNRRMNSGMDQSRAQDKPKEIPVEVTVRKIIEKIKPELTLDALQEIAISNILMESIKTQGMLIKAEVSQEDKIKNIQALSEVTDRKIMELLNKDQKEKYTAMNEEAKNPKKSKVKKKAKL